MKRRNQTQPSQNYLFSSILAVIKQYYPWLLIPVIAYLFLFPSSLFVVDSSQPKTTVRTIIREEKISYAKYPKILVFLANRNNRGKGKLIAVNTKEARIDGAFNALSGVGGKENQRRLGPIPSNGTVKRFQYQVDVKPLTLPNRGIEGKFYTIHPHVVPVKGGTRSDFGIHADRNVPGTAGCIGIESETQWTQFKALMLDYQQAGLKQVPLLVSYR